MTTQEDVVKLLQTNMKKWQRNLEEANTLCRSCRNEDLDESDRLEDVTGREIMSFIDTHFSHLAIIIRDRKWEIPAERVDEVANLSHLMWLLLWEQVAPQQG